MVINNHKWLPNCPLAVFTRIVGFPLSQDFLFSPKSNESTKDNKIVEMTVRGHFATCMLETNIGFYYTVSYPTHQVTYINNDTAYFTMLPSD